MTKKLTTTFRLMMVSEPKETKIEWTDKLSGAPKSMLKESLEAYILGSGTSLSVIDINLNKFVNNSQVRDVKITELLKAFIKNEDDLKAGRKLILAEVELLPIKNAFSESGVINRFEPYLSGFTLAETTTEADLNEVASILRCTADSNQDVA